MYCGLAPVKSKRMAPKIWVFCIAALLAGLLASPQMGWARGSGHRGGPAGAQKPVLLPLKPIEDIPPEMDPVELFDQAVDRYSAGKLPEAEKLFEKVLSLQPDNADAHYNLGAIKEWRKDYESALHHYRAALAIKPHDREISEAVRSLQIKLKNETAARSEALMSKHQEDLAMHGQQAKEAFANHDYPTAIVHLNYLAAALPDDPKVQFALGQSLRAIRNFDWAAYRLKMAIYLDPENELYRRTLAELDDEIEHLQSQAYDESAKDVISRLRPLAFTEATESGVESGGVKKGL
jgi:tetratricopeptide (TPR) repeat protein